MFLCTPSTHLFTLYPSSPAIYTPSPRERYVDALARLRAAEASYLIFEAAEREEEALTHCLRELQLRKQEDRLRTSLGQYFSGDAYQLYGLNNLGAYQEDYPYMINVTKHQAFKAGHDCYCCDGLDLGVYPCTYCTNASIIDFHLVGSSSSAPSLLDNLDNLELRLAESQALTPISSFLCRRQGARPLPLLHPYTLQYPFNTRCHGPRHNDHLKNLQASAVSKPHPVEKMSDDGLSEGFAKPFDAPTAHVHRTNEPMRCSPETVPSRSETPSEYDILSKVDFAKILHAASSQPDAEIMPGPNGEAQPAPGGPADTASFESKPHTAVPAASTTPSANPSTADPPTVTTVFAEISSSFNKIRAIEATFNTLKENFDLPVELDFVPSTPSTPSASSMSASDSDTESTSATDYLTYSPLNRPVRSYEQALTVLLEQLDGVESLGDADVRKSRREVVKRVELALEELEREVEGRWMIKVLEPLIGKGKVSDEVESNVSVLGLALESESESEREVDTQKQDRLDDRAYVISAPFPEIIEQNDSSTVITTVNSSDEPSARTVTTSVHGNNAIQAPHDQLEFSDTIPVANVANIPPSADHTITGPVEITDSISSPVLIVPATISFSGDAEPTLSISSATSVHEPTTLSIANAIIPVDTLTKSVIESPSPLPVSENTGLTTVQGADVEPEGFFLTFRGTDEPVSEHPIVGDSDDDWLEVGA